MLTLAFLLATQGPPLEPGYWINEGGRCADRPGGLTAPTSSCTVRAGVAGGKTIGAIDVVCDGTVSRYFPSRVACVASTGAQTPEARAEVEALQGCLDSGGLESAEPLAATGELLANVDHLATLCACTAPGIAALDALPSSRDVVRVAVTCLRRMGAEPSAEEIAAMEAHARQQMPGLTPYALGRLAANVTIYGGGGLLAVFFIWRSRRSAKSKVSP